MPSRVRGRLLSFVLILIAVLCCSRAGALQRVESGVVASAELAASPQGTMEQGSESDHSSPTSAAEQRPRVCGNTQLGTVFEIISEACARHECDISKLGELDTRIGRSQLLGALRNPDLRAVHLFFPMNESSVENIFDWRTSKLDQLDSLGYAVSRPEETVVFVIGKASANGSIEHNRELSRDRTRAVMRYIKEALPLPFHHIHGAWVGREVLQFAGSDARALNLEPSDFRQDDLVLNQAVHVFLYPCAEPMADDSAHQGGGCT